MAPGRYVAQPPAALILKNESLPSNLRESLRESQPTLR
jgi:hypothetical protein